VNGSVTKVGSGTLRLSGSTPNVIFQVTFLDGTVILDKSPGVNAISGAIELSGILRLAADNQIADTADVLVFSTGSFDFNGHSDAIHQLQLETNTTNAAQVATGAGTLTLGGDLSLAVSGTGAVGAALSGNLSLGGAPRMFNIADGAAAVDLNLAAVISGAPFGFSKTGSGTARLSGNSAYTGPTVVAGGTLVVDGTLASAVTVSCCTPGPGTLGGLGSVAGISASSGAVAPGDSPGILSSSQSVSFQASSAFDVEIVGTIAGFQYDRLSVTGNATLAGTLNVSLGYSPALGDSFTILTTTGTVSGTFAGLPEGALIVFGSDALQIHYTSNAVVLTVSCTGADALSPAVTAPAAATVTQTTCS